MCTSAGAVRCCYKWIALERTLGVKHLFSQTVCNRKLAEALRRNGSQCVSGPFFLAPSLSLLFQSSLLLSVLHRAARIHSDVVLFVHILVQQFANPMSIITAMDQVQYLFSHLLEHYASSLWWPVIMVKVMNKLWFAPERRERERKKLSETNGSRMVRALFGSKIEIKFTSLVVSFAMCTKWLQYTRSSLLCRWGTH